MIGEGQVKYYRGQVTMTVISPGQETIPEEETEAIPETKNPETKKSEESSSTFARLRARLSKRK